MPPEMKRRRWVASRRAGRLLDDAGDELGEQGHETDQQADVGQIERGVEDGQLETDLGVHAGGAGALREHAGERHITILVKGMKSSNIQQTPMTLNRKWARAARLALTAVPMEASQAVMVVPMFSPSTIAADS
jgi:hypothetical protein